MNTTIRRAALLLLLSSLTSYFSPLLAQGTAFTYQGRFNTNGSPYTGSAEFQFTLWDAPSGGSAVATNNPLSAIATVTDGLFTVTLDFGGSPFNGQPRFVQTDVRTAIGPFTTLTPRQSVSATPYALRALNLTTNGLAGTYGNAVTFNNPGNSFAGTFTGTASGDGSGMTNVNAGTLGGVSATGFWKVGGNAGTTAGTHFIGTTDDTAFDIRVNSVRAMRFRVVPNATITNAPNVIGGSANNSVASTVVGATIGGGGGNESFDGTEYVNRVTADFGTVSGGLENTASGLIASTVSGGRVNTASSYDATVGGGRANTASGRGATVPGGSDNLASGDYSLATGNRARAIHDGSFVWADDRDLNFSSTTSNQFRVRATGGAAFVTAIDGSGAATAGVRVQSGDTSWSSICDRNEKKNFQPVDAEGVLEKLATMPVESWNYKWEADTNPPHLGPMAQDFKAAFYPGRDDKSISTLEFDGVELAAIQGLNEKVELRGEKAEVRMKKSEADIQKLTEELKRRDAENAELKQRLERLERLLEHQNIDASFP